MSEHTIENLLNDYHDRNRPLLVFAPTVRNPDIERQRKLVKHDRAGFADRDMLFVAVLEDPKEKDEIMADRVISGQLAAALRDRFDIATGEFKAVLCDRDGREIRREDEPTDMGPLFEQIDQISARQREAAPR